MEVDQHSPPSFDRYFFDYTDAFNTASFFYPDPSSKTSQIAAVTNYGSVIIANSQRVLIPKFLRAPHDGYGLTSSLSPLPLIHWGYLS